MRFLQQQAMANRVKIADIAPAWSTASSALTPGRRIRAYDPFHADRRDRRSCCSSTGCRFAFRAFCAIPTDLSTPNGITHAVFGFTSMLVKVLGDEQPTHRGWCSTPGRAFRDDLGDAYKANRKEAPDIFVPRLRHPRGGRRAPHPEGRGRGRGGRRRDATLATQAAASGTDVVIVTGDRDAYQLVRDPHLKVLYNRRRIRLRALRRAGILERTGVTPAQCRTTPRCGVTRATTCRECRHRRRRPRRSWWRPTAPSKASSRPWTPSPKQRQNLGDARDRVFLNRQMSLLRDDVPLDVTAADLGQGAWDREQVRVLFDQPRSAPCCRASSARWDGAAQPRAPRRSTSRSARDAGAVVRLLHEIAGAGGPYALEPVWEGAPVTSPLRAVAVAHDGRASYLEASLLTDAGVREVLAALVAPGARR